MDSPLVIKVYDYDSDGTNVSNFCENVKWISESQIFTLYEQDFIGEATTSLRELVSASPIIILINKKRVGSGGYVNSGLVTVGRFHEVPPTTHVQPTSVTISVKGHKLTKKDFAGKSGKFYFVESKDLIISICLWCHQLLKYFLDPYLVIKDGSHKVIHKTETIQQNLEPVWQSFTLNLEHCGGLDNSLTWEVYDWDKNTKSVSDLFF